MPGGLEMLRQRLFVLFALLGTGAGAQWLSHPTPGTPRTKDGKPNLSAKTPRLAGKPDLSGVWELDPTPVSELKRRLPPEFFELQIDVPNASKYLVNLLWDFKPEDDPSRPEAKALLQQRAKSHDNPTSHCLPGSVPFSLTILPFKIVQTPRQIVMLFEHFDPPRQIYTDGRPLPKDPDPLWMGYAVGRWQGDTLVVESAGFNDKTWLDGMGHPRSESARMTERYHRRDFGHLDVELTVNDPKYYTRAFTVKLPFHLIPDSDVLEAVCAENEKDRVHLAN
jgi:hypothetical protein